MKKPTLLFTLLICSTLLLSGCWGQEASKDNIIEETAKTDPEKAAKMAKIADPAEKAKIQKAMSDFIDNKIEDGKYDIDGNKTEFDYLHDGVKLKDGKFIACADFKSGDDVYDVDYYVVEKGNDYEVVKEVWHKLGKRVIDQVLWEK